MKLSQVDAQRGGSNQADTQEPVWKTYRSRLRKLIFANLPLLLLIIGCLPLFFMVVSSASPLRSHIAASTHFGVTESENSPSSETPSATSSSPRVPPATANEDEVVVAAKHQNAPQSFGHHGVVTKKASHNSRAATHHEHRRYFKEQHAQGERRRKRPQGHWTSPAPVTRATRKLEPEPPRVSERTGGPFELLPGLTGPKGKRLARRLVRKRRTTTTAISRETSAKSTSLTGIGRPVVSKGDQDARKRYESKKLAEHVWEIIAKRPEMPTGRIEDARRTSLAPTWSARSSPKDLHTGVYIRSMNESCFNPSHCGTPSHDGGGGSRRAGRSEEMEPVASTLLHSPESLSVSTRAENGIRKAGIDKGLTKTIEADTTTLDLFDWLFAHGVNNRWSRKVILKGRSEAQPRGTEGSQAIHPVNAEVYTSDITPQRLPAAMTFGDGSVTEIAVPESERRSPDRFSRVPEQIFETKAACTPPEFPLAVNISDDETFRKFSNHAPKGESAPSNEDRISIPESRLYLSDETSTSTLSGGLSSSLAPSVAVSHSKESTEKLDAGKPSENDLPAAKFPPSEHEYPLEANNETQVSEIEFFGSASESPSLFPNAENGDKNLSRNLDLAVGHGGYENYDDDEDDIEEEEDDDDDTEDNDDTAADRSKQGVYVRSGLFHTFTKPQGALSGTSRRNRRSSEKNVAAFNRPLPETLEKETTVETHLHATGNEGLAAVNRSSEPSPYLGDAPQELNVSSNVKDGALDQTSTILAEVTPIGDLRSVSLGLNNLSGRPPTDGQIETSSTYAQTAAKESVETRDHSARSSSSDLNLSPHGRGRELQSGTSNDATMIRVTAVPSTGDQVTELRPLAENHKPNTVTEVTSTTMTETMTTHFADAVGNTTQKGSKSNAHSRSRSDSDSESYTSSPLSESRNVSVVPASPRTDLLSKTIVKVSTRRRRFETSQHDTAPDIINLTSPTGTISYKAIGHALPEKLDVMCSIGATYDGPFPVGLCDKIMLKDAVAFDQVKVKFTVRSYDAFLELKAQQMKHRFKIVGLMTWRNIEQFRLVNPSSDSFVEKVERLLLRINFDGLCMDLAGVTRGNILAYRHILRDMRVKLMDTKFLCSLFDYNVLYKASFQDLLSLLRVFNTTVIHQNVQSISKMETSVPNALRHLTRRKYSLSAALELAMDVRGSSHHRSVCWTLTPWGMEYRLLLPTEATGVGVLARFVRSAVAGADLCSVYGTLPRYYDNLTASWYLVNDTKWIAYDDRQSLEKKIPELLVEYAPDCVYVEDVQRDDAMGVCDRPFPLVSSLQGMLSEALKHTTHLEASVTTTISGIV